MSAAGSTRTPRADNDDELAENAERGMVDRLVRALELLASAHAARAKAEANADFKRIITGVVLWVVALIIAAPIILLLDAAASMALTAKLGWPLPLSLLAVVAANTVIAVILFYAGRAKLRAPILPETRETLKRAAVVLRGA
ncbi:MAG: phage holin family protein [Polyangiaceae bacterium]